LASSAFTEHQLEVPPPVVGCAAGALGVTGVVTTGPTVLLVPVERGAAGVPASATGAAGVVGAAGTAPSDDPGVVASSDESPHAVKTAVVSTAATRRR
jgi:hypothetical protein